MLRPLVEMFAARAPHTGEPLRVPSASADGTEVHIYLVVAWTANDIRAIPSTTCGASPPAYVGSCNMCEQKGVRPHGLNTTVIPGAVRALDPDDPETADLRTAYETEFKECHEIAAWARADGPPPARTKASAVASGNRVLALESTKKAEAYYDVDWFTQLLWYHDKIAHTMYDLAHEFSNVIKQTFNFMLNKNKKNKLNFTVKKRSFENDKMQRLLHLLPIKKENKTIYPRPGWVASKKGVQAVDALPEKCRVPSGWADFRKMFEHLGPAKTAEALLMAGDAGAYVLKHADIDENIRDLFILMFRIIERCAHTHYLSPSPVQDRMYVRSAVCPHDNRMYVHCAV